MATGTLSLLDPSEVTVGNTSSNPVPVQVVSGGGPQDVNVVNEVEIKNDADNPVAVSATSLPLPSGAATEAKQLPDNHQVQVSNFPSKQAIADSTDSEYLRVATSVTTAGDTTLVTPAAGKRIRLQWVYAINDPTALISTKLTVKLGTAVQYVAWAISKRQQLTGAVDAPLVINLSAAGDVAVTVFYQEV